MRTRAGELPVFVPGPQGRNPEGDKRGCPSVPGADVGKVGEEGRRRVGTEGLSCAPSADT